MKVSATNLLSHFRAAAMNVAASTIGRIVMKSVQQVNLVPCLPILIQEYIAYRQWYM